MAYYANRDFRADGRLFRKGDVVPAENWRTRQSLLNMGWMAFAPDPTVKPLKNQTPKNLGGATSKSTS